MLSNQTQPLAPASSRRGRHGTPSLRRAACLPGGSCLRCTLHPAWGRRREGPDPQCWPPAAAESPIRRCPTPALTVVRPQEPGRSEPWRLDAGPSSHRPHGSQTTIKGAKDLPRLQEVGAACESPWALSQILSPMATQGCDPTPSRGDLSSNSSSLTISREALGKQCFWVSVSSSVKWNQTRSPQGWMRTGTGTLGLRRGSDFRVRVISPLFPLVDSGGRRSMQKVGRRSGWSLSWVTSSRSLHLSGLYFMHEYC